jgi:hypothetical protein
LRASWEVVGAAVARVARRGRRMVERML